MIFQGLTADADLHEAPARRAGEAAIAGLRDRRRQPRAPGGQHLQGGELQRRGEVEMLGSAND